LKRKLNNYICNFVIYENNSSKCNYTENLENVIASRCLVDIVKEGQSGLTMRVLEAALYQKKLITNNWTILDTDLYHKNNVFILDYDNLDDIDDFMKREIVPVSEAVLQKYDINHWLKEFLD
jgi:1,5-rhamnosyltransferase